MKGLDIKEISGNFIKRTLQEVVEKRLGSKDVEIWIEPGSKKGDNFIGEIFRIIYQLKDDNNQSSLILKIAAQNVMRREKFRLANFFVREIRVYNETLPIFHEFQLSKSIIPQLNGFNEYAQCYSIIEKELSESLFLEDLRVNQFEMLDHRKEDLTFEHVALVMKALGKLHAISFALRDQQPEIFAKLTSNLEELYYRTDNEDFTIFLTAMGQRAINTLNERNLPKLVEKFARAIEEGFAVTGAQCVVGKMAEPYTVLCHGDVWINNTMFRKDAQDKPIEVKLFDWQFSRYATPVTDIILFLLSCTRKSLRDQHYDELVKIYYETLSNFLTRLGSDPNKLFPYEALLDQLKQFGKYGVLTGIILIAIFTADPNTIPDLSEFSERVNEYDGAIDNLLKVPEDKQDDYKTRICELIGDAARFGYL